MDNAFKDPVTGRVWDLSDPDTVKAAWRLYYKTRPKLLICSPPCTHFSQMQNINPPPSPEQMAQSIAYVELSVAMCKAQLKSGRHFVYEHPAYARSWDLECLQDLKNDDRVLGECTTHVSLQHGG